MTEKEDGFFMGALIFTTITVNIALGIWNVISSNPMGALISGLVGGAWFGYGIRYYLNISKRAEIG